MSNVHNIEIILKDNVLKAEEFIQLRVKTGFREIPIDQAKKAMENSLIRVSAVCDGQTVGMGRMVGDGAMYWYLQEIIVLPEYQRQGIGTKIVERLLQYAGQNLEERTFTTVGLVAAKGKEPFYETLGFTALPSEMTGAGMRRYLEK